MYSNIKSQTYELNWTVLLFNMKVHCYYNTTVFNMKPTTLIVVKSSSYAALLYGYACESNCMQYGIE